VRNPNAQHKEDVDLIKKAFESGKIKIRFINAVYGPSEDAQNFLKEGATLNAFNHHFTQRTIKVIFDGALGSRGAACLDRTTMRQMEPAPPRAARRQNGPRAGRLQVTRAISPKTGRAKAMFEEPCVAGSRWRRTQLGIARTGRFSIFTKPRSKQCAGSAKDSRAALAG